MNFPSNFSTVDKLESLSKWIIVHSMIYYNFDSSIVSDYAYDRNVKQFMSLDKTDHKLSKYYYVMYDFTGHTGYHLSSRLNQSHYKEIYDICSQLLYKSRKKIDTKNKMEGV